MTDKEFDRVYDIKDKIEMEVTRIVNGEIKQANLTDEQEDLLRDLLTESYRFWKQYA
jgi:hypothetical protein